MIRPVVDESDIRVSAGVVRRSFTTVARQFGLTEDNCPTNAAFITGNDLVEAYQKGVRMFGYFDGGLQAGFVALENVLTNCITSKGLPYFRNTGISVSGQN